MSIRDLCNPSVVTVQPDDEVLTAAALMRDQHIGYLVVVEPMPLEAGSRPVGVLTDRDIVVEVIAKGVEPTAVSVADIMSRNPVVVSESRPLADALDEMRRIGVRRVPVVSETGRLVGVLSLDAVIEHLAQELGEVSGSIRSELNVEQRLRP